MGPRSTRGALMFLLLVGMAVGANEADYIPPSASGFARTVSKVEGLASPAPIPSPGSKPNIRSRVILSVANGLSLALSLSPFFIRWVYGSWFITREIFPAKGVTCNLVASATWTVNVMLQMYANRNYAGEDVLLINSVTITSSVCVLLTYFLNGKEHKKYWIFMIIFTIMVCCGMGWLVWHPNIIVSPRRQKRLKKASEYSGIVGIGLFALVNTLPFSDLWAMTVGDRTDLTLLMPMMFNSFLGSLASALWTIYAWAFDPQYPNYFMIANAVAAGLAFVQGLWLLVLRIFHREVVGQITDVESLRSVFLSVSRSLDRLAAVPRVAALWTRKDYLLKLQDGLDIGWQSLSLMERTFSRLEVELMEKAHAVAIAIENGGDEAEDGADEAEDGADEAEDGADEATVANQVLNSIAVAAEASANAALALCRSYLGTCRTSMIALDGMKNATKHRLSNTEGAANEHLITSIRDASEAVRGLANPLRSTIQIINATEGIPSTVKVAFHFCREQMLSVKSCVDSEFLLLGCGAFSLRSRMGYL